MTKADGIGEVVEGVEGCQQKQYELFGGCCLAQNPGVTFQIKGIGLPSIQRPSLP